MSWLSTAQQEEDVAKGVLERDVRSRLENASRFYLRTIYYRVPNPSAGGKWQAFRCETGSDEVLNLSPFYATKNNAIRWAVNNAPPHFYDDSDRDDELYAQFRSGYRVTVNGWDFTPIHRGDDDMTFVVSTHPSTAEAMGQHRRGNLPSMSTRVHHRDASILRRYAFSRFNDLVVFLTSKSFRQSVATSAGQDMAHDWSGSHGAFVPSIVGIVRELADRFRLPAGVVFTGRTVDMALRSTPADRPDFDVAPYDDVAQGVEHDDVFLSFRNGLIPPPDAVEGFRSALEAIVRRHFPDRQLDVVDGEGGTVFAIRRSATERNGMLVDRFRTPVPAQQSPQPTRPRTEPPRYEPEHVDQEANAAFDAMYQDDAEFAISVVGLKKEAQVWEARQENVGMAVSSMLSMSRDDVFCLEKNRYGIRRGQDGKWVAYVSEAGGGRSSDAILSGTGTVEDAISRAATAADEYARFHGYQLGRFEGSAAELLSEIDATGRMRTNAHDIFIRRPSPVGGVAEAYVLERVPLTNSRTPSENMVEVAAGDADVLRNYRFTRMVDAKVYLATIMEFDDWESERRTASMQELEVDAAVNALREVSMPPGTRLVSRRGWEAMDAAARTRFCGGDRRKHDFLDNLRNSSPSVVALLFDRGALEASVNDPLGWLSTEIRERLGYAMQGIPDLDIMLVDVSQGSGRRPVSRPDDWHTPPPPEQPVPEQDRPPAPYVGDRDRFKDVLLPEEDDEFGVVFSSVRRAGRKPIVVSFDYDGTTVFPVDTGHGEEYDEDGEPVSELNPDAAELMRLHASRGDRIVIVTCRPPDKVGGVWRTIRDNGLPVEEVYATSHASKAPTLRSVGAAIHYDDSPFRIDEIRQDLGPAIRVCHVDEMARNMAAMGEQLQLWPEGAK